MTGREYDVVVVGSGAAGMVAALTAAHEGLSTVLIEKAPHFGGSTARSGGGVWIPNNEVLRRDGVTDTAEAARTYPHGIIGDVVEPERIDAYLDRAPEMLSFVVKHTPLRMCSPTPGIGWTNPTMDDTNYSRFSSRKRSGAIRVHDYPQPTL